MSMTTPTFMIGQMITIAFSTSLFAISIHQGGAWLGNSITTKISREKSFCERRTKEFSPTSSSKFIRQHCATNTSRRKLTNKHSIMYLDMARNNDHNIAYDEDDDGDDFGDDSFLLNFDVEQAIITNRNKRMNSSNINTSGNNHHTPNKAPRTIQNPYANRNSSRSNGGRSLTKINGNTLLGNSSVNPNPFGEDSKFTVGNVDTTQYMDIPNRSFGSNNSFPARSSEVYKNQNQNQSSNNSNHNHPISSDLSTLPKASPPKIIHTNNINAINTKIDPEQTSQYISTLTKHFGYESYRKNQLPIIHTIIHERNDVTVFWSTGSGKSLCYQIPPLHLKKIAIIVSPLISLMEDQVSKLNGLLLNSNNAHDHDKNYSEGKKSHEITTNKDIAVYLGSGQMDSTAEFKALQGEYTFIYCTPEKLLSGGGDFLNSLAKLHQKKDVCIGDGDNICLFAIDESHCVSEWGHDFRPEFRSLGNDIRSHSTLSSIPIIALTATAIPRVQKDIISSLRLRNPKVSQQSFDRTNLVISIKRKPSSGGFRTALRPFVKEMKKKYEERGGKKIGQLGSESTIIYCPTQGLVEEVSEWLSNAFENESIQVQPYHGGMSNDKRTDAHINFLTGKTPVIVATIAFGMGIDKPDTRRIIHWGPPKTVEEYYQQIGRAGRDGLESYCIMYCNAGDFEAYKSDFYLGKLGTEAKEMQIKSIDTLRSYALSDEVCRRAELLKFFGEEPSFGERCGTCDTCQMRNLHPDDIERDFANEGARLLLFALSTLNGKQGSSVLEKVLRGNKVEGYRYRNSVNEATVGGKILEMKGEMKGFKKKMPVSYFTKDLLPALVDRGFVEINSQTSKTAVYGRRSVSWSGYDLTSKGWTALDDGPIVIPVPASVREAEQKQKQELQESLKNLERAGVDLDQIPKSELEEGDGEVLKSLQTWHKYLDTLHRNQKSERVDQLDDLRLRLEAWRSDMAVKFRMAPGSIMQEHLLLKVAYAAASLKKGQIEREALVAVGVRSGGIDDLQSVITGWLEETLERKEDPERKNVNQSDGDGNKMIIPDETFTPAKTWEHFQYKPNKKTGLASWESSYNRFTDGEHPQTIAMSPANGRPIQVATVVGHIFDGLISGRPVNLKRVSNLITFPTENEWNTLMTTEQETGMNVLGNPKFSGKDGDSFKMLDFLTPILGEEFAAKPYDERTQEEKALYSKWCQLLKAYMALRRIGYVPSFEKETGD